MAKMNICQYWKEDEPSQCKHWTGTVCGYKEDQVGIATSYYPRCNNIGTAADCNHYKGEGFEARCILPDPYRHICNRKTGEKWLIVEITKYDDGKCDGEGTEVRCSGYTPYHMAFGPVKSSRDESLDSGEQETRFSKEEDLGYRLPLNYEIYNARAKLSRCYWWDKDSAEFEVDPITGEIKPVTFKCVNSDDATNEFSDFKWSDALGMDVAPCNGAKPECPGYTGVCWQYCIDEFMRQGDKVLAEQILELRYYLRRENWTSETFKAAFNDPTIKAWAGTIHTQFDDYGRDINWIIDAINTYISDFETFSIERDEAPLIAGTLANDFRGDYPTLVGPLKNLPMSPIIRSKFDRVADKNIFETTKLQHKNILIVGDVFYYNSKAYGINLNDPVINTFLPPEIKNFDNMYEIRANYFKNPEKYEEFYYMLDCVLDWLVQYQPDSVGYSEVPEGENFFMINMPTFFDENEIVVFDKGSGTWEYSKITVIKILCNGVIGQTGFSAEGSGGQIMFLPDYQEAIKNGLITFEFFPFFTTGGASSVDYIYNDSVKKHLEANPTLPSLGDAYELGYKLFKVKALDEMDIELENFRMIGNTGHILVIIPDKENLLHNVFKPWELDEDKEIILSVTGDSGEDHEIPMEIVGREENIDKLEINQLILRPKSILSVKQACDAKLNIGPFYTYEKRSFNETPDQSHEEIREQFLTDDDRPIYVTTAEITQEENKFSLTGLGYMPLVMSVVFKGVTGRRRGQTKTKMITWVRQPYCRDVEIYYTWYREYQKCKLLPEFDCFGSPGMRCEAGHYGSVYVPPCGDHDLSPMSEKGPMWYPYEECDSFARYNITGNLTEWDISMMEPFLTGEHGSWDMRMFGPVDQNAYTCDAHASLWACGCDWSFCNTYAVTGSFFQGWGRYRGGIKGEDMINCVALEGSPPQFGNVFRDFLRSYRSIDNVDYYYFADRTYQRRRKWVPVPESFSIADVTADGSGYGYLLYCSNDYYNDTGSFIHPFGLLAVTASIEGVMINENIDGGNEPDRYRYEDIFESHHSVAGLNYPYPKSPYFKLVGGVSKPIISWHTYKDCPEGDPGRSIQWAWQEIWKPIERYAFGIDDFPCVGLQVETSLTNCIEIGPYKLGLVNVPVPGSECLSTDFKGRHVFLDVQHPDYKYDAELGEHRLVCDEGPHIITFIPPSFEEVGGTIDVFFWIKLDGGMPRAFDVDGNWDPPGAEKINPESVELYKKCTVFPWLTDVTLFAEGYDDPSEAAAEADGRVLVLYDGIGEEFKMYYQRGLDVSLLPGSFDQMPGLEIAPAAKKWSIMFNTKSDCGEEGSDNFWDNIEIDTPYESQFCMDISYCSGDMDGSDTIELEYEFISEENGGDLPGWPSRVMCQFSFGAEKLVSEEDEEEQGPLPENVWFGNLYHIPAIEVLTSSDGVSWSKVYESDKMELATKNDSIESKMRDYSWNVSLADKMSKEPKHVKLRFRISPNSEEVEGKSGLSGYYIFCTNMIKIECVYIYLAGISEAEEKYIWTYERRYNISSGQHGDFPPHGYDSTTSLLNPLPSDFSTVYQRDCSDGTVGIGYPGNSKTMNKCRGRIMFECHEDKEPLPGSSLGDWEAEQKKIHDAIAMNAGKTTFRMDSVCPPGLEEHLIEAGVIGFPKWFCYFVNTLPLPLAPVIPRGTYSAPGHYFDWDFSSLERKICGKLFARVYRDVFKYVYKKASTGEIMWDSMDAIASYYLGTGKLHTTPANYTAADADRAEHMEQTLMAITTQRTLFEAKEDYSRVDPVGT